MSDIFVKWKCFFLLRVDFIYAHSEGEGKLQGYKKDLLMIDSGMHSFLCIRFCNSDVQWKGKKQVLEERLPSQFSIL